MWPWKNNRQRGHRRKGSRGVTSADLTRIARELDQAERSGQGVHHDRIHRRFPVRGRLVTLTVHGGLGDPTSTSAVCRNISRDGISVLHVGGLDCDTHAEVSIPHPFGQPVMTTGRVVRCVRIEDGVCEIGLCLDTPMDVRTFIAVDPLSGQYTFESADPKTLMGCILLVGVSDEDTRIITDAVDGSALSLTAAHDRDEVRSFGSASFDAIVCADSAFGLDKGVAVEMLRQLGTCAPIIVLTDDARQVTQQRLRDIGADGLVLKPLERPAVLAVLAEFLLGRDARGAQAA